MSVAVGDKVSLPATVKANPPPVVTWTVDGQEIGGDLTLETERSRHWLTINKTSFRNSGTYQIKAVNDWGEDVKDMVLNVIGSNKNTTMKDMIPNVLSVLEYQIMTSHFGCCFYQVFFFSYILVLFNFKYIFDSIFRETTNHS